MHSHAALASQIMYVKLWINIEKVIYLIAELADSDSLGALGAPGSSELD